MRRLLVGSVGILLGYWIGVAHPNEHERTPLEKKLIQSGLVYGSWITDCGKTQVGMQQIMLVKFEDGTEPMLVLLRYGHPPEQQPFYIKISRLSQKHRPFWKFLMRTGRKR
jgi:hypothetical protein